MNYRNMSYRFLFFLMIMELAKSEKQSGMFYGLGVCFAIMVGIEIYEQWRELKKSDR